MKNQHDTMSSLPSQLYDSAQIRELERISIEELGISAFELMTRAGRAVFDLLRLCYPAAIKIVVFCGAGNNGGDGFVVARLALLAGLQVELFCLANPAHLNGAAQQAYLSFKAAGGRVSMFSENSAMLADVLIDALLGTGLVREVSGLYAHAIKTINMLAAAKIAVDIPSGIHADTGKVLGCAVNADITVTFIGLKQGLFTGAAPDYGGEIHLADLAVPDAVFQRVSTQVHLVKPLCLPKRSRIAHKGNFGHVLIIGGDAGYSGAVRLAGEAALRMGAGLVSIATHPSHALFLNSNRPELMCQGVETDDQLSSLLEKANVVVLGPGLGQSDWSTWLFNAASKTSNTLIVDADGLNLLAKSPHSNAKWILTPHPGEAGRLLNVSTAEIQADRFNSARAIQQQYGGIVVLKGAGTLIATADDIAVVTAGNPGMASGGMGDVLTGVIAALFVQFKDRKEAARQGAYLHGAAADLAAKHGGERGLLASDLFPQLRRLVN